MLHTIDLYYFSPTGGTKKVAETFCREISKNTNMINLGIANQEISQASSDLIVVAAPVFGGRIPALVAEKLSNLDGNGKKAVALAVYGIRAYEDALLELTDVLNESGFQVAAAGAFNAQHSIVPEVGQGRPDAQDILEIQNFARKVSDKLENDVEIAVKVPGNHPYKERSQNSATPVSNNSCSQCGICITSCPTGAIQIENASVVTNPEKCMLCMACVSACPQHARMLPQPVQETMNQKLGALKAIHRENEFFL